MGNREYAGGFTVGSVCAAVISYTTWHSIPWLIVHGACSWGYVLYWAITHS